MSAPFPSLLIRADRLEAQGPFAEAQAEYLHPDPALVARLSDLMRRHGAGIVAHFYMDPELQGVLAACAAADPALDPFVHVSDSLLMADAAVRMAEAGARRIVVLGVDFMSENVRAVLDSAGRESVPVYRVAADPIGCSLAAAAASPAYDAYLRKAARTPRSLHVIYINTGLDVKANAQHLLPTLTCTSSNVVRSVLQADAQIPGVTVWFGPDTYMGRNLHELFTTLAERDDAAVRAVHPAHDAASLRALCERFHWFEQGTCVVHELFGSDVARRVQQEYAGVDVTAHLEVPGEMFRLALAGQRRGAGVVGSTSDILTHIGNKVTAAAAAGKPARLRFVLGTEAGMITSIVRRVQAELRAHPAADVSAEIVFPVASEAIARSDDAELAVVPGAGGEGCSTAGGCATCPYMKMNSLDALFDLLGRLADDASLVPFHPRKYLQIVGGRSLAALANEPIRHMRAFQRSGTLPQDLVDDVLSRSLASA